MRAVGLLALLAALVAAAPSGIRHTRIRPSGGVGNAILTQGTRPSAMFEFHPESTGESSVSTDMCDYANGQGLITGTTSFCLRPDGGYLATGLAVSAVASPVAMPSTVMCPSGYDCTTYPTWRLNGSTQGFKTTNVANPAGSISVCWFGEVNTIAGPGNQNQMLIGKVGLPATAATFELYTAGTTGVIGAVAFKTNASSTSVTAVAATPHSPQSICATYKYVADGSSELRLYVDGLASGTPSTTAVGPLGGATTWVGVGYNEYTAFEDYVDGYVNSAFWTETLLTAAQVLAIHQQFRGALTTRGGTAVATVRASRSSCSNSSGGLTVIPPAQVCVGGSALKSRLAAAPVTVRDQSFLSPWVGTHAGSGVHDPTITASDGTSEYLDPDGTNNAVKVSYEAITLAGTASNVDNGTGLTVTAIPYTFSLYVRSAVANAIYIGTDENVVDIWHFTRCTTSTSWTRCTSTATLTNSSDWYLWFGGDLETGAVSAGTTSTPGGVFYVYGAQLTPTSYAQDYCGPALATPVSCSADKHSAGSATTGATPSFAASATVLAVSGTQYILDVSSATTNRVSLYLASGTPTCAITDDGGTVHTLASSGGAISANASTRVSCSYNGATIQICVSNACNTSAVVFTPSGTAGTVYLGYDGQGGASQLNGNLSNVCIDSTATRCL